MRRPLARRSVFCVERTRKLAHQLTRRKRLRVRRNMGNAASYRWSAGSSLVGDPSDVRQTQTRERSESESDEESREIPATRTLSPAKAKELEDFKKRLAEKAEVRKTLIAKRRGEMQALKEQLETERRLREEAENENKTLRDLLDAYNSRTENNAAAQAEASADGDVNVEVKSALVEMEKQFESLKDQSRAIRSELAESNLALQSVNQETSLLNKENFELKNQIKALKDVTVVSKQMLAIRETQLVQLKDKLAEIESSMADRETRVLSSDLRVEYERQLENIRNLKLLYEERARVADVTKQNLIRDLADQRTQTEQQTTKCGALETRIEELEKAVSDKDDILGNKESQLGLSKAENRGLQTEMTVINKMFSQMLLGCNNAQDLDKLLVKLEENHDLLADVVVREDCSEVASALPKLILDLVNQMDASNKAEEQPTEETIDGIPSEDGNNEAKAGTSAQEIVGNLPKVWRVLTELLSHQAGPPLVISDISDKSSHSCYNSVQTPSGPRLVPSVSKTYIRLKDLILEKKSLQKEMNRLKQLNSHLENRFSDQERRLGLVSSELSKTWHIVGRMQRQHQQLHTHEKILRFELHEKRLMLKELREELEFCKDKWDRAKQKNSESQIEWNKLRQEFASRKVQSTDSVKDSGESGYSDERASDDESAKEDTGVADRRKEKSKTPEMQNDTQINEATGSNVNQEEGVNNEAINLINAEEITTVETVECNDVADDEGGESVDRSSPPGNSSYDDVLAARSARLKKLEEQCYVLVHKVTKTNNKGVQLCNRLEELHNQYGGEGGSGEASTSREIPGLSKESSIDVATEGDNQILDAECQSHGETDRLTDESEENCQIKTDEDSKINDSSHTECEQNNEPSSNAASTSVNSCPDEAPAGTSSCVIDYEARFAARDERFKIMEEQAKSLVNQVSNTSTRSIDICSKLDALHNTYGRSEEETVDDEIIPEASSSDCVAENISPIDDNVDANIQQIQTETDEAIQDRNTGEDLT